MMRSPPSGQPQRDLVEFWRWAGQIELSNCGEQLEVGNARRPVAKGRGLSAHVCPVLVVIRRHGQPTLPFAIGYDAVGEIDQETDGVGGRLSGQAVAWRCSGQGSTRGMRCSRRRARTFLLTPGGGRPENEKG